MTRRTIDTVLIFAADLQPGDTFSYHPDPQSLTAFPQNTPFAAKWVTVVAVEEGVHEGQPALLITHTSVDPFFGPPRRGRLTPKQPLPLHPEEIVRLRVVRQDDA